MSFQLLLLRSTLVIAIVFSFSTTSAQDSIRTEVFTLSTCDPDNFTLIKDLGPNTKKNEHVKKLEVRSNKTSVFQITGINPLRYKYYINNEAVTQFMESSPLTLSINTFINGDYFATAPEIKIPEIFKTDSISTKVKFKIHEFQVNNKRLEDSVDLYDSKMSKRWFELLVVNLDTIKTNNAAKIDLDYRQLVNQLNKFRKDHDQNSEEYQMYIAGLPLNNPRFAILREYSNLNLAKIDVNIDSIIAFKRQFAIDYLVHTGRFKTIDSFLTIMTGDPLIVKSRYTSQASIILTLRHLIRYYSFAWSKSKSYYGLSDSLLLEDNVNNLKEQILNKQFQLYEEFVMNLAMRVGVLVQNQFREYSSFNNTLENFKCIDSAKLRTIDSMKRKLTASFEFIQKTSAELQIMVSYLDINTELYQNIARKINNNYVFLLSYLKNLEFVTSENAVQYTLPTHTNLKNVDLIRYTVKRDDKITKNAQTYNYDFWIKGGLKIDFSVGFFGTSLTDNVYNKVLLDTAGGIDKIRITRQDDGQVSFAFGGMVNILHRNGASWLNIGGSIGVAYSGNQKLQVLTGLAFHLGKTERVIIHAGAAFGSIKYLDISANDFKFYDQDLKSVPREKLGDVDEKDRVYMLESNDIKFSSYAIPTAEKFVVRPFFGISYNLSKKSALQAVSGAGVNTFSENYKTGISY